MPNSLGPVIPEYAYILDYFDDGYRLGKPANADNFHSIGYASSAELGLTEKSRTFGDRIPYARYESTADRSSAVTAYVLDDIVDDTVGFTVEYFIRTAENDAWVKSTAALGPNTFLLMMSHSQEGVWGHSTYSGWSWQTIPGNIISTPWHAAWHHIAYTVLRGPESDEFNITVRLYVDGIQVKYTTNWAHGAPGRYTIWTSDCLNDSNYATNYGFYDMTQVTVWNYIRYTGNSFYVPRKLYVDGQ